MKGSAVGAEFERQFLGEKTMTKHETIPTPCKSETTIKCRGKGCRKIHEYKNEMPIELTCSCGYLIAEDGVIWPSKKEK